MLKLIQKNVELGAPLKLSGWRKIAIGTWRTAGDPSVYSILELDADLATKQIEKLRSETGVRVTMTHFIGRVLAECLKRHPDINCILRFGRLYPRKNVDIFFQVASDVSGRDLSGMTIRNASEKTVVEIAQEMESRVKTIRTREDKSFKSMKKMMKTLPGWLSNLILTCSGILLYKFNIWSPLLGSPRDPFGSAMITNIGSLGIDMAFAPLVPYSHVPLLLALGAVKEQPVVRNGKIEIGRVMKICVTFDHRLIDGMHASHMVKTIHQILSEVPASFCLSQGVKDKPDQA